MDKSCKIVPCISCHELYHWEPCAQLTASEIKELELKKKPLMVYRCPSCDEASRGDIIPDLNGSINDINQNINLINKNITEIEKVREIATINRNDIVQLKGSVDDVVTRVCQS